MARLADVNEEEERLRSAREGGQRRISVEVNVRGRDLAGFVAEAQKRVSDSVQIPQRLSGSISGPVRTVEVRASD